MNVFTWSNYFITGLESVDEQHHQLINLINQFGRLVTSSSITKAELDRVFGELSDYANYHFSEEEKMMKDFNLDNRHIDHHLTSHKNFIQDLIWLNSEINNPKLHAVNFDSTQSLMSFLTHWLSYHILGIDQYMAKQIFAIKSGKSPEQSYLETTLIQDPSMEILLNALNGLLQQISERNQALELINRTLEERVIVRTQELIQANQRLEFLANTDILTNLPNRRYALQHLNFEWERAQRESTPLSCLMIDADGFKIINDTYGHDAGDIVLRTLSAALHHNVRTDDVVCRLGGDEFLIICSNTPLVGALKLAENLRRKVAEMQVAAGSGLWKGSISVGVAVRQSEMEKIEDLLKVADEGVYLAKRNGRNYVATIQDIN